MTESHEGPAIGEALPTIDRVIEAARANLDGDLWDYLVGGAESEMTLRRNRTSFDRLALRPRALRGATERDAGTTYLGAKLAFPVLLAPVGSIGKYHPDGALACARVAERLGILPYISNIAEPGLATVRAASDVPVIEQMYVHGDRGWVAERLAQAEELGCSAICFTDYPSRGRRDRNPLSFFGERPGSMSSEELHDTFRYQSAMTWDDVAWMAGQTKLPLIVKGVMTGDDALLAIAHGAAAVHVSNHGGRQLDHMQSTIEVLPEIVAAVDGEVEVAIDSGIVRGSDVVKALALGARAVAVGKLMVWGLAAAGEPGLEHVLTLLHAEIDEAMAHLGATSVSDLTPERVASVDPVPPSDWIGFAGRAGA